MNALNRIWMFDLNNFFPILKSYHISGSQEKRDFNKTPKAMKRKNYVHSQEHCSADFTNIRIIPYKTVFLSSITFPPP